MDWNVVAQYLPLFEKAAWLTLRLGLAGIALAIVIGLVCALVQYYKVPVLRRVRRLLHPAQPQHAAPGPVVFHLLWFAEDRHQD